MATISAELKKGRLDFNYYIQKIKDSSYDCLEVLCLNAAALILKKNFESYVQVFA